MFRFVELGKTSEMFKEYKTAEYCVQEMWNVYCVIVSITCGCYIVTYSCVYCRQNILSLIMLCTSDIYALITYSTFVESFFILLSVSGILWLRYKKPDIPRPIKVSSLTITDRLVHYIMVVRKCIWSSAKIALVHPVFQN